MADTSLFYYNDKLGKTTPRVTEIWFNVTGAKTMTLRPVGFPVLTAFDAIAAQSTIDNFLGTTAEFNYLAFDATSMGTDAVALIVDMGGQVGYLAGATAHSYSSTNFSTAVVGAAHGTGLTNTTLATEAALGANGNVAARFVLSGNDSVTSGVLVVKFYWISK